MLKKEGIRIRDPFILTDKAHNCYYMYGTTALLQGSLATTASFSVYKTTDLENFEEPKVIFAGDSDFWADRDFWAPEVHRYNGKYYLFGSGKRDGLCRGTQIFVCDTPDGSFAPVSPEPVTPRHWECLDGTLWVENSTPYMIFCHEWLQVKDGEICAMPLTDDLSAPAGKPTVLFRASDNPDVTALGSKHPDCYVTDGPFLFTEGGKLKMIWSSFHHGKYLVLEAESESGSVLGPWHHLPPRFDFDGGHAMLFEKLDGTRMISLHAPNKANLERPLFLPY
ncbi:MAG: family 43 glycosylhydrolase [Clostridia bacterium]|nr:family 43 glycosylhydrolase [Clostridia bacterium]